jgi:prepilin-type N-terminal cleavage/methylation domain-containing protein
MTSKIARPGRAGFTLLEVLLAMAIAVMLLGALYVAVNIQLTHAQAGRDLVEQTTLVRSILTRIDNDIAAACALDDSARYRLLNNSSNSSAGGGAGGMGGGGSGAASGGGSGAGGGAGAGGAGGGAGGSGASTDNSGSPSGSNSTTGNAVTIPFGVQGDSSTLSLYVSKLPRELWDPAADVSVVSDLRRVSYWLAGGGLARQEVQPITSQDVVNLMPPNVPDETRLVIAPEVKSLTFSYFDGNAWQDTWDATTLGADGITPIGAPRAIAVTVGISRPVTGGRPSGGGPVKLYRHVVAIPTANGATQQTQTTGGGTTTP